MEAKRAKEAQSHDVRAYRLRGDWWSEHDILTELAASTFDDRRKSDTHTHTHTQCRCFEHATRAVCLLGPVPQTKIAARLNHILSLVEL